MSRLAPKNVRVYVAGRDMSGYARGIGPLKCEFQEGIDDALSFEVKKVWLGMASIGVGNLNGIFDNTATSGIHALLQNPANKRTVLVALGMDAPPVNGVPCFAGQFKQGSYTVDPSQNPVTATIPFSETSGYSTGRAYARPWGVLLHALEAETGANSSHYIDQLAQTTKGGFMCYQVTAALGTLNMTGAIKVQHSATTTDGDFSDLLTTGTINMVGGGVSGIVALPNPTTVKQYIRYQTTFGSATSITYALGWFRNNQ